MQPHCRPRDTTANVVYSVYGGPRRTTHRASHTRTPPVSVLARQQPNYDGKSDKGLTLLWIPRVNSFSISRALELLGKAQDYSEPYASQPMTAWFLWEMEEGPEKISLQLQGWSSPLP